MSFYPMFIPLTMSCTTGLGWKGFILYFSFLIGMLAEIIGLAVWVFAGYEDILFANGIFFILHFIIGFTTGVIISIQICKNDIIEWYEQRSNGSVE